MSVIKPLPVSALYRACDTSALDFDTTAELPDVTEIIGQARALEALQFGVGIRRNGYNLYVLGPAGLGKHTLVRKYLEERAGAMGLPSDWCYVNHFAQPNKPRALQLPAGGAAGLRKDMETLIDDLLIAIPAAFDSEAYQARLKEIENAFHARQEKALNALQEQAQAQGIALLRTPAGFAFAPRGKDNGVMSPETFNQLPAREQERLGERLEALQDELQVLLRQLPQWRKELREQVRELDRETTLSAVGQEIEEIKQRYAAFPAVQAYLDEVQQDILENVGDFRNQEESPDSPFMHSSARDPAFRRYQVNVLVDHSETQRAPVIYEDNPLHDNLLGRVEHLAQMGTLVTDFMLIKPGALHRANGGFLMLDAHKVLLQPYAWEAIKRVLSSQQLRLESLGQMLSLISTVSLEPEPIPLDVKVVLLGDRLLYYLLYEYDPEFGELFKVAADFEEDVARSEDNTRLYASLLATMARQEQLRPLQRDAVARVLEFASRKAEDVEKFSVNMSGISDLLRESDYLAGERQCEHIGAAEVDEAIRRQHYRAGRIQETILERIQRGTLLIDTAGARIGQVNGLSIIELGDMMYGHPVRITATARLGEGELVDIEREVELGGAIHSKGVLILSSYLAARFALRWPLSLSASLVFEQSYGQIEGDSASVGELCALLSALAEVPVSQALAVTGSVNQLGEVQPIGGVNEKIEGFFDVCRARTLDSKQGVIIPASNVEHLMLRADVREAVAQGQFQIYAVRHVDEVASLLTGLPAGERDAQGEFAPDSLNRRVEDRLREFSELRHEFGEQGRGKVEVSIDAGEAGAPEGDDGNDSGGGGGDG